jgi:hypothetical protein
MTAACGGFDINRRRALGALVLAGLPGYAWSRPTVRAGRETPLPSPNEVRRAYQHMVDFGPRLPGHPNHIRFVNWMAREFEAAGLHLGPCTEYAYRRWDPLAFGLDIQDGDTMRAVPKVAHYVRSAPTGPKGVTGPLVHGGKLAATGPTELGEIPPGAIVVFEAELPRLRRGMLGKWAYVHGVETTMEAYLDEAYKRLWLTPAFPLDAVKDKGAAGVVIIMDVPSDMIGGNFSPHSSPYKPPVPALFVGQDVGAGLKADALAGRQARLTLHAEWIDGAAPSVMAVLPGTSDEVMILNTHTDGQNFIEENGCIALLQLARHFAGLPAGQRLRRTLVFAGWPGHMTGVLPECAGWMRAHKDLVGRAAAAFTIEHLGATEWDDVPGQGYAPTGRNEYMNLPATAGPLRDLTIAGLKKHDLKHHGVQIAPGISMGSVFHDTGVPHVGCISGPNYLLGITPNGHIDKLDADLAARQTRMLAELIIAADAIDAATLRANDPSLGEKPVVGEDTSRLADCRTATAI